MPTNPIEFHNAVSAVHDFESYKVAHAMTQDTGLDINSTGADGKSALNYAFESLFTPLLRGELPPKIAVEYKLKTIDQLCSVSADLAALQHPDTYKLREQVMAKAQIIIGKAEPKKPCVLKDAELADLIAKLPEKDKIFLAAYYISNEIIKIATRVAPLEKTFRAYIAEEKFADIKNKLLLIFENHEDRGAIFLASVSRDSLMKSGYTTICMQAPMHVTMDLIKSKINTACLPTPMKFLLAQNNEIFASNVRFIDPRTTTYCGFNDSALFHFTSKFMSLQLYSSITDKGLFYNLCQAAVETDGKAVAIFDVISRNIIISKLIQFQIPFNIAEPIVKLEGLSVRKNTDKNEATAKLGLIFSNYAAMPIKVNPPPTKPGVDATVNSRFTPF